MRAHCAMKLAPGGYHPQLLGFACATITCALSDEPQHNPLRPDELTWAALLAQWVEFAKRAVGLPKTGAGRLMRDSVPDVIMLQAVWFALEHIDELEADERALGLDRAEVLIERHADALRKRWGEDQMPGEMVKLIEDARAQLGRARG